MSKTIEYLIEQDAKCILHPASSISALVENGPQMMTAAEGCYVTDADGKQYLDAIAGLWCVNAGYGCEPLAQAMADSAKQLSYYHTFSNSSNPWQVELAEKLIEIAPKGLDKVFFGNSGSEANDTLMKIAWHYHSLRGKPSKVKVIAREQAYHGTSISTASLTGLGGFHKEYPLPLDFILRTDCPHFYTRGKQGETESEFCDRLIENVRSLIERENADTIAAFFAEPIHAAGGIIEPPEGYYPKLKQLLKQYDILLIADEVVCGYGRLGSWVGSDQLELVPDMLSSAKGLTSGYFPLSAALISNDIWRVLKQGSDMLGAFSHGYTYSGHPVGAAVALANLDLMMRENLIERAAKNGKYLHECLRNRLLGHANVGEIRGRGLLAGIQLVADKASKTLPDVSQKWPLKITQLVREKGFIIRPLPSVATLAISPPLIINKQQIDDLIDAILFALDTLPNN